MNKRILLVHIAAFILADDCAAAIDETFYSAFPKLDHGAQMNGGVQRMLRGNEETPKTSDEERAGGKVPVFHDFLQIRSNVEEPLAAVRNVPNEWNFELNQAFIYHFTKSGVKMDKVRDKMRLLENHGVSATYDSKLLMALGSEYFELPTTPYPSLIIPKIFTKNDRDGILDDPRGPQFVERLSRLKKYGVSPEVFNKIKWLQHQQFGFEKDISIFLYMAFGSEFLKSKQASTSRASLGETLSLATPGTHVHGHPEE